MADSMALIVKICGLSTPEALDVALDAGADMVGFVFFPASPRSITLDSARVLGARVAGRAKKVALTVDADDELLSKIIRALAPDFLQLHGVETPERVLAVRAKFKLPIIKALPIEKRGDFDELKKYALGPDWERTERRPWEHNWILFDAKAPKDATRPGGLGRPFDWHLVRAALPSVPVILSGGLNSKNIEEALRITRVPAVDVSSGVESSPGVKDAKKIREFIQIARHGHVQLPPIRYEVVSNP
jgi:phosphoribosylanthranilate isomerase